MGFGQVGDEEPNCEEGVGALFAVGEFAVAEGERKAFVSRLWITMLEGSFCSCGIAEKEF